MDQALIDALRQAAAPIPVAVEVLPARPEIIEL